MSTKARVSSFTPIDLGTELKRRRRRRGYFFLAAIHAHNIWRRARLSPLSRISQSVSQSVSQLRLPFLAPHMYLASKLAT